MSRTKYTHHFDHAMISNRWRKEWWNRNDNWVFFGASINWFSSTEYEYRIHFFGIDIRFWFVRKLKNGQE